MFTQRCKKSTIKNKNYQLDNEVLLQQCYSSLSNNFFLCQWSLNVLLKGAIYSQTLTTSFFFLKLLQIMKSLKENSKIWTTLLLIHFINFFFTLNLFRISSISFLASTIFLSNLTKYRLLIAQNHQLSETTNTVFILLVFI